MSFIGWVVVAYVVWSVISAVRKGASGGAAHAGVKRNTANSRDEAHRRLLESMGLAQGQRSKLAERLRVPADRTAVRTRRTPGAYSATKASAVTLDHDDEAEGIIRERNRQVAVRNRTLAGDDHAAFDARMRREDAAAEDAGRGTRDSVAQLRKLIVWQEILGRPVALKDGKSG